jgi:hypothetical protein
MWTKANHENSDSILRASFVLSLRLCLRYSSPYSTLGSRYSLRFNADFAAHETSETNRQDGETMKDKLLRYALPFVIFFFGVFGIFYVLWAILVKVTGGG